MKKGISLRRLAEKAGGMSYTYLCNVENGKADPSLSTLERIAAALNVTVGELVGKPRRAKRKSKR